MLFNSIQFALFFPVVTLGYFALPHRHRWAWLLAASCLFYMAFVPAYILVLGFTIVIDYAAGLLIERADGRARRNWLALSLVSNVGVLAFFKYTNFVVDNVNAFGALVGARASLPLLRIVLPIGLSFHTFQAMAYTIEVYRGNQRAERHFGLYALYVMFYPQLVAGPIERPQNILPQLRVPQSFDYDRVTAGLRLMAWGLFQKLIIADRLALVANPAFARPAEHHGLGAIAAAVAFTFEIYFDFSAYSNIAIGAARVMGIRLMTNFRRPFWSKSIAEFWARWHISLSTWFRDYLYIPLGGNRVGKPRHYANLMTVFVVSGLWHGANWTFVVWGALHGTYLVFAQFIGPRLPAALRDRSNRAIRVFDVATVFVLVSLAFVFFRADNVGDALTLIGRMPVGLVDDLRHVAHRDLTPVFHGQGMPPVREVLIASLGLSVAFVVEFLQERARGGARIAAAPVWVRWPAYAVLTYAVIMFSNTTRVQFIYFQF